MAKPAKKSGAKKKVGRKKKTSKQSASEVPVKSAEPVSEAGMLGPSADLNRQFGDFIERHWLHPFRRDWPRWGDLSSLLNRELPSVDVVDRKKEVLVRAEVPGIDREDLDVSVVERTLTIKGSSRHEEKQEDDDYFRHEIKTGSFSRTVLLPTDVNASKAKANFKDGVVEIHFPKVRVSKRHKVSVT